MDSSSPPPPPSTNVRQLRPFYLVAALVVTWIVGVQGIASGFATASYLREGHLPDATALSLRAGPDAVAQLSATYAIAERIALGEATRLAFPISVATVLLSGLLVVASGLALTGRRGAQSLALQALLANSALAIVTYILLAPVRDAAVGAAVEAAAAMTLAESERAMQSPLMWKWLGRMRFGVGELGLYVLTAIALTRPRSTEFFRAASRAAASAEDP